MAAFVDRVGAHLRETDVDVEADDAEAFGETVTDAVAAALTDDSSDRLLWVRSTEWSIFST